MAKTIRDEDIKLSIIVNGNQAQKEIYELEKANRKLIESNQDVKKGMLSLAKQGKKKSDEYINLTKTLNQNNATLELNKLKIRDLEGTIGIANLTLTQLRRRAKEVQVALVNMTPGTPQFKAYNTELAQLNARISELKGKAVASGMSLGQVADKLNRYQSMIAGIIAVFAGVYLSFQQFVDFQHKIADAQADVMKTTGLTKAEVDELTKSFNSFNTRTPRMELLKLAEEGGRLGIEGSENLRKYVNVANQLKVALGDDLSDTQIREVGKLTEVYKIGAESGRDFEQSMMSLGSAINEVAASGANQAGFQVDYLKRQAGIAAQAKIGAANNIGYAATFDEIGQSVEVSATAMNKVWMDMFRDSSTYAKIAGMSIKDFNVLLQKDSNEAMKAFLRGLNGNNEGLSVMVTKLSDLDVGGVRGAQALSALSANVGKLEQKQKIANQALIDNISLTNEYNVKNNNVAATLDKIQKKIQGWFTSDSLVKYFETGLDFIAKFIGATEDADGSVTKWKENLLLIFKILMIVTATVLSYKAAVQLAALWTNRNTAGTLWYNVVLKSQNVLTALGIVRTQLFAAAQMLLKGNVKGAAAALRQLNLVLGLSPWGAVIALIGACTAAYFAFRDETDKVITKQKLLNDVRADAEKSIAKEISQIEQLFSVAKNENLSKEQRIRAIEQLNKISPEYLGNLRLETINTIEASKAIGAYIQMLRKQSTAKAFAKKLDDIAEREVTAKNKKQSDYDDYANLWGVSSKVNSWLSSKESKLDIQALDKLSGKNLENALSKYTKEARLSYQERRKEFEELKREKELTEKGYEEFLKVNPDQFPAGNDELTTTPAISSVDKNKKNTDKAKKEREKELNDLKKHNEELEKEIKNNAKKIYQLVQDNEDTKVSMMKEGYEKDVKELQRTNEKKIQALESQLHSEEKLQAFRDLMAKTEKEAHEAEIGKDREKAALLRERIGLMASVYQQLLVENKEIQSQLVTSWEVYNAKLSTITEKGLNDRIAKIQKEFEDRQKNDKSNFAFEISQLTTLEKAKRKIVELFGEQVSTNELARLKNIHQAKKVLQREFNKKEIEDQKAHLEDLVRELNYMLNSSEWEGMDLTVLTEEQKEDQLNKIEELKEKIAELQSLIGKTGDGKEPTGDGLLSSLGGSKDILGMNPEQWEKLFAQTDNLYDKLAKVIAVAHAMKNAFSTYYEYVNANEQARVQQFENSANQQKSVFKKQLEEGYISQETYDKKVTKLENELAKRKAIAEYKAAKRKRTIDIASAITSTSLAIVNALATVQPFWAALAMSAVAASMGALQIATIQKSPLPSVSGYESGFYNTGKMKVRRNEDGKIYHASYGGESRSGLVDNPTVFLAGEGGKNFPEMIIDGRTLTRMRPEVKEAMYQDIARIKGFEKGYYPKSDNEDNDNGNDDDISLQMLYELKRQNEYLKLLAEKESIAVLDTSPYQMGKFVDAKKNYDKITNNGKIN